MSSLSNKGRNARLLTTLGLALALAQAAPANAQQRLLLPEGTVLTVRTETALNSQTAQVGQKFSTVMTDSVRVDGYTVIPENSKIEGTVSVARQATSQESGLIGVEFDRIVFPNGRAVAIDGRLTSTDPAERRQIEAQGDARVVFVGGRSGFGAAIGSIGAGAGNDPVAGIFGALGSLLSKGADVTVPTGTALAVQLAQGITLAATNRPTGNPRADAFTIYTSAEMIRAAQTALRAQDYYRGPIDGRLTEDTQRALFEFQIDNRILATGNLDGRTASVLKLSTSTTTALALSAQEAALVRRNAQVLAGNWRTHLAIPTTMRLDPRRNYEPAELELHLALSACADNASLYDQMVRVSGNADGVAAANMALVNASKRVDAAFRAMTTPVRFTTAWRTILADLSPVDDTY